MNFFFASARHTHGHTRARTREPAFTRTLAKTHIWMYTHSRMHTHALLLVLKQYGVIRRESYTFACCGIGKAARRRQRWRRRRRRAHTCAVYWLPATTTRRSRALSRYGPLNNRRESIKRENPSAAAITKPQCLAPCRRHPFAPASPQSSHAPRKTYALAARFTWSRAPRFRVRTFFSIFLLIFPPHPVFLSPIFFLPLEPSTLGGRPLRGYIENTGRLVASAPRTPIYRSRFTFFSSSDQSPNRVSNATRTVDNIVLLSGRVYITPSLLRLLPSYPCIILYVHQQPRVRPRPIFSRNDRLLRSTADVLAKPLARDPRSRYVRNPAAVCPRRFLCTIKVSSTC